MSSRSWRELVGDAANDRISGAQSISVATANAVQAYLNQCGSVPIETLRDDLRQIAANVLQGQPSMAPVLRILNDVLFAVDTGDNWQSASQAVQSACERFIETAAQADLEMQRAAASVLPFAGTVVTLSYSSAVVSILRNMASRGADLRVICLESRPAFEGRRLAADLSEAGLRTTVVVDAASYDVLREADLWLCGADSLTIAGIINKMGTAALSVLAGQLNVPGYAAASTHKIWPAELRLPPIAEQDTNEVWADAPEDVEVVNRYFDLAPWDGFQAVISEHGLLEPQEIAARCQGMTVHTAVHDMVTG